ncbi:peptidylprolyl isomerase [Candidatus Woesearchaeota archaeon]|nr:peptidylprolyl isomerase [Candidatus Woesearchaeota archaeon]
MPIIKKRDFVEMDYTGRLKEDGAVFDTTEEKVAKESGVYDQNMHYHPAVVCIGENNILKELEDRLIGKETGREYSFEMESGKAFGRKDAKLIQMIPLSKFKHQKIQPMPGLQLNIDGVFGIVKTVSGGRVLVDFNHPLAGKDIVYDVKIKRIIEDDAEKVKALLHTAFHMHDAEVEAKDGSLTIKVKDEIPSEAQEEFRKIAERAIGAKSVAFKAAEEKNK